MKLTTLPHPPALRQANTGEWSSLSKSLKGSIGQPFLAAPFSSFFIFFSVRFLSTILFIGFFLDSNEVDSIKPPYKTEWCFAIPFNPVSYQSCTVLVPNHFKFGIKKVSISFYIVFLPSTTIHIFSTKPSNVQTFSFLITCIFQDSSNYTIIIKVKWRSLKWYSRKGNLHTLDANATFKVQYFFHQRKPTDKLK